MHGIFGILTLFLLAGPALEGEWTAELPGPVGEDSKIIFLCEIKTDGTLLMSATNKEGKSRYGELIELSASGQIAMRRVLQNHLRRVEWAADHFPIRLYPFVHGEVDGGERPIAIDPVVAFGRPIVVTKGVTTAILAARIDAGETVAALAADYDLSETEIEQAILYERAA